jgi:hypothetical protein
MLSGLNQTVNRTRSLRRQLGDLKKRIAEKLLGERTDALVARLDQIEGALVDMKRETPRDVLRNPAGLNDTLVDLINVVAIADTAPTVQARQVSDEIMAKVDGEIKKLDGLITDDIAAVNAALRQAGVEPVGWAKA